MVARSPAASLVRPGSGRLFAWPDALILAGLLVPATFVPLAAMGGGSLIVAPNQHFYIVSAVSIMAALVAGALALATIQIGLYRVLFLCLGFMSLCAIFAVHGLTTPGVLVPDLFSEYTGSAVAISAYLSLAIPALFLATSYAPGLARLERRLPFWPAGWLVLLVVVGIVGYAGIAVYRTALIAALPLSQPPYSTGLAILSIALFIFAALRQARSYRRARLVTQAFLLTSLVLLADAAAAMVLFTPWTLGWWYYHVLMLTAVGLALNALLVERARAQSFRSVIETALELQVSVDVEELDFEVIAALVAAVEVKDRETQGHNRRVAQLSVQIGRQLGMSATELRVLARTGLLHDVGKLGVPDAILEKHGPLTESESAVMKTHPEIGVAILKRGGHFKRELLGVLYHHERMDGSGYPHGLVSEAIPIEARIVAVADTYDVLTTNRPYRQARGGREARRVVEAEAGTHLDPQVVVALMRALDRREAGSAGPAPTGGAGARAWLRRAAERSRWVDNRTA